MAEKITMPSSGGGLVRYFDEFKSKFRFKPGSIVILAVAIIIIMIILHTYGKSFLGI